MDWKDLDYHLFWETGRPISDTYLARLKDGKAVWNGRTEGKMGYEETVLDSVTCCGPYAIVDLGFSVGGGSDLSFSLIELLQMREHRLELLGELSGRYLSLKPKGLSRLKIDCAGQVLTAGFQVWNPEDADCCPTKLEVVRVTFGEGHFDVLDRNSLDVPEPEEP